MYPSWIAQSELHPSNVAAVLENDYVNPSDIVLQKTLLLNLSFGSKMESPTKLLSL